MLQVQLLANRSIVAQDQRAFARHDSRASAALMARGPRAAAWGMLLLSVCMGVATAFFRLGAKGLWGDEVWQVSWAQQQPLVQTFLRFRAPPDLPLHFLLTQIATAFAGGAFWVRLPSALLGAATVVLVFLLGRRVFDTWTAFSAAV